MFWFDDPEIEVDDGFVPFAAIHVAEDSLPSSFRHRQVLRVIEKAGMFPYCSSSSMVMVQLVAVPSAVALNRSLFPLATVEVVNPLVWDPS